MILRSSKTVALILIGSMSVLWGFKSCVDRGYYNREVASTQPGTGTGSHWYGWGRGTGYHSYGGSSSTHSGTSRGGFGSSGHAAGS